MRSVPTTSLDLTSPDVVADPYLYFAEERAAHPVAWHQASGMWLAFDHASVSAVQRDRRLGRLWHDREPAAYLEPFNLLHRNQMMENEPPVHTRLRSLVAKSFGRGHVERLRPRVEQMTAALLDGVDPDGFDLIADYAEPLPVAIVAELLGVPENDRHLLRPWSQAIVAMYEYGRTPDAEDRAVEASAAFADYMRDLADERRAHPRDDLVSHLAAEEDAGERLTGDELVASAILLLNAGHEASVNGFGNGIVALLAHPDQLDRLRVDRSLVEPAVEEMLRFDSPLQLFERTAQEDVVVGDAQVAAGTRIAALLGAANRDPAAFEDPDRLLRCGAAPLPRGPAGPDGAADRAAHPAGPLPAARADRQAGAAPDLRAARLRGGAGPRLTGLRLTGRGLVRGRQKFPAPGPVRPAGRCRSTDMASSTPAGLPVVATPRSVRVRVRRQGRRPMSVVLDLRTPSGRRLPW
jgi:cytochrome P450